MKKIPMEMENGYILIQPIKDEKVTKSGIYIPDENNNRFSRVLKTCANSILKEGDIIITPIGRTTGIKLTTEDENGNRQSEIFQCLREGFVFAKLVEIDDENNNIE